MSGSLGQPYRLTAVQLATLGAIRTFLRRYGRSPSLRELAAHLGIGLSALVHRLNNLEAKGLIARRGAFSIRLISKS